MQKVVHYAVLRAYSFETTRDKSYCDLSPTNMPDDGAFNFSQNSNHDVDNDVESNNSQVNLKDVDDNGDG